MRMTRPATPFRAQLEVLEERETPAVLNGPLVVGTGGQFGGQAQVSAPDTTGHYPASPTTTLFPFAGVSFATVRSAVGDVNGDGTPDYVLMTGPGSFARLTVISGADTGIVLVQPFDPFGGNFTGGGFVAAADLNRDGTAEVIVSPDQGGGPRVVVFSFNSFALQPQASFLGIDDPNFRGGARVAAGDVNGDGFPDVVVAAGFGGGPRVSVFNGTTILGSGTPARVVPDFYAFPGSDAADLRNGAFVAAGDINGDGVADLIFGGGPGGAPRVFILSGLLTVTQGVQAAYDRPVANFFVAGDTADRGGVRVAAKDVDGNNRADLVVGSGQGSLGLVRVYLGTSFTTPGGSEPPVFQDLTVFGGAALADGVYVG